ncbi:MAG: peptidoglycan-associated lipoprotein [Deltaproteobacteria bacterium]|nr:peptidoglycan-associated lipoprotein [Deltaproteobacteria bacterium]
MKRIALLLVVLSLIFVGCAQKTVQTAPPVSTTGTQDRALSDEERARIAEEELARAERDRLSREQERLAGILKDVYFDFDSYAISGSELPKIEGVSSFMKQDRGIKMVVEGHCDERGTVDYNLALGQKRAEAVKDYLVKMGVESSRVRTISYGKEVPAETGNTEEAWAKNRRAHFKIDQKG